MVIHPPYFYVIARQLVRLTSICEFAFFNQYLKGLGLTGKIQTAFIERLNLTIRHLVAALSRRGWALAENREGLRWRVALAAGYYKLLPDASQLASADGGGGHYRGRTPAMALGVTDHCWSVHEFITHPVY